MQLLNIRVEKFFHRFFIVEKYFYLEKTKSIC